MKAWKRIAIVAVVILAAVGVGATPALALNTTYPNCPANVACIHTDIDGGGVTGIISVGNSGYNRCWNMSDTFNNTVSSASSDFGGGWDLKLFMDRNCSLSNFHDYIVHSSHFVNFNGANCIPFPGLCFNDEFSSYRIELDY